MRRRKFATAAFTSLALPGLATAQNAGYPARAIHLIVPFPVGGPVDAVARKMADMLSARLGQPVVVENKSGANGAIGTAQVARAPADGYTLALAIPDSLVGAPLMVKAANYDPLKDFTLVSQVVASPLVMMASSALGVRSVAELMAKARGEQRISYGSWGPGTMPHLIMSAIEAGSTARFTHVGYRGVAPALQDLVARQVDLGFGPAHVAAQYAQKGYVHPIAVSGPERSAVLPHVPTLAEQGYKGVIERSRIWIAVIGPAGLPQAIVDRWGRELWSIGRSDEFEKFLAGIGFVPLLSSPGAFRGTLEAEKTITAHVLGKLGIRRE